MKRTNKNQGANLMTPLEIKHALERAGTNQTGIAKACGVSTNMVRMVRTGERVSRHIAEKISGVINAPIHEIWPGLYKQKEACFDSNSRQV